jgi:hypothetical protein
LQQNSRKTSTEAAAAELKKYIKVKVQKHPEKCLKRGEKERRKD